MHFVLLDILHRFRATPNQVEVTLSIESEDYRDFESGKITVTVESVDVKSMTIAKIESLAIARAKSILLK